MGGIQGSYFGRGTQIIDTDLVGDCEEAQSHEKKEKYCCVLQLALVRNSKFTSATTQG